MGATAEPTTYASSAVVMIDRTRALVARNEHGRRRVTEVDRNSDSEQHYLLRIAREAAQCDRLVVMGPGSARLAFEREYVSLYRRPDRLTELTAASASRDEVLERLRTLEGEEAIEPGT